MPGVKCSGCGRMTNTAISDAWSNDKHFGVPTECYAAYVDGEWVPGCAYGKKGDEMNTYLANTFIPKEKQTIKIRKVDQEEK